MPELLRLNLGSGQRPFAKPWVNVDCQDRWSTDVLSDIRSMPMFKDSSAGIVVLHQVLEHFGCGEADGVIRECQRILAPGGSLIVTVPNLLALVKGWISRRIDTQIFLTSMYGAYMGDEADRHRWQYDAMTLDKAMRDSVTEPWREVKPFDYRQIEGANIAKDWWILGVEAVK